MKQSIFPLASSSDRSAIVPGRHSPEVCRPTSKHEQDAAADADRGDALVSCTVFSVESTPALVEDGSFG